MKQFSKIFRFEFLNYLTKKVFIGVTLFLIVVIAAVTFFPRISALFEEDVTLPEEGDKHILLVISPPEAGFTEEEDVPLLQEAFAGAFPEYAVHVHSERPEQTKFEEFLSSDGEACAFILDGWTSYTYYVDNLSMYDMNAEIADEVLQSLYRMRAMTAGGLSPEDAQAILTAQVTHETVMLGKDQFQNYFYTYIMVFALYMVILLYGQFVATNVASEKSSRAMEVLITSADPVSMMFGKVLASCLAGLTQLIAIFGASLVFFRINESYWEGNAIIHMFFDIPGWLFLYMLVFFVLGFLFYAFLFGAVGSTVSKLEDVNTAVMPVTMLFIITFVVVISALGAGVVDTTLMRICSFLPFSSPMAMFARIAMSHVPVWEIALSIAILTVSVVGVGVLSAKIYRVGVLLYGTRPKPRELLKALRNA